MVQAQSRVCEVRRDDIRREEVEDEFSILFVGSVAREKSMGSFLCLCRVVNWPRRNYLRQALSGRAPTSLFATPQ